jgi:hypothetical protein
VPDVAPHPFGQAGSVPFHQRHDRVLIKREKIEVAHKRVLYIDHSKFERRALDAHRPISRLDVIIVESNISSEDLSTLHDTWVAVMLAPVTPARPERCDGLAAPPLGQISPRN